MADSRQKYRQMVTDSRTNCRMPCALKQQLLTSSRLTITFSISIVSFDFSFSRREALLLAASSWLSSSASRAPNLRLNKHSSCVNLLTRWVHYYRPLEWSGYSYRSAVCVSVCPSNSPREREGVCFTGVGLCVCLCVCVCVCVCVCGWVCDHDN